jgi:hypothetical protein
MDPLGVPDLLRRLVVPSSEGEERRPQGRRPGSDSLCLRFFGPSVLQLALAGPRCEPSCPQDATACFGLAGRKARCRRCIGAPGRGSMVSVALCDSSPCHPFQSNADDVIPVHRDPGTR